VPTPSRPQLAIYAAAAIAVLLIGARFLRSGGSDGAGGAAAYSSSAGSAESRDGATPGSATDPGLAAAGADGAEPPGGVGADGAGGGGGGLVVDVKGAVRRPGVYRLPAGSRALDAVRRAGGLTHRADRVGVNLAARVVDGGEVVVPERGRGARPAAASAPVADSTGAATGGPLALDLNTATEQQLEQLDGVGPTTATKIVAYRTQHGGIDSVDELDNVSGIGPAKLAAIRAQLGR
jgi:competence protein ComEA